MYLARYVCSVDLQDEKLIDPAFEPLRSVASLLAHLWYAKWYPALCSLRNYSLVRAEGAEISWAFTYVSCLQASNWSCKWCFPRFGCQHLVFANVKVRENKWRPCWAKHSALTQRNSDENWEVVAFRPLSHLVSVSWNLWSEHPEVNTLPCPRTNTHGQKLQCQYAICLRGKMQQKCKQLLLMSGLLFGNMPESPLVEISFTSQLSSCLGYQNYQKNEKDFKREIEPSNGLPNPDLAMHQAATLHSPWIHRTWTY